MFVYLNAFAQTTINIQPEHLQRLMVNNNAFYEPVFVKVDANSDQVSNSFELFRKHDCRFTRALEFLPWDELVPKAVITSEHGEQKQFRGSINCGKGTKDWCTHPGIDIASKLKNADVKAWADGIVEKTYDLPTTLGHAVLLRHSDHIFDKPTYTLYLHLKDPPKFEKNDCVLKGAILGTVGKTGFATGPHLHFEIRHFPETYSNWGGEQKGNIYAFNDRRKDQYFLDNWTDPLSIYTNNDTSAATALIIDRSGSMVGYVALPSGGSTLSDNFQDQKKLESAKSAAKAFVAALSDTDMISVSSFSEHAGTQFSMAQIGNDKSAINVKIDQIQAQSSTNIGAGLSEGFAQLDRVDPGVSKMAILLSDGENTTGAWRPALEKYKQKKWPVCTIGFGSQADEATLRTIATETGCSYEYAETTNIVNKYQELSAHAAGRSIVLSATDMLPPDGKVNYPFEISPDSQGFVVFSSWQGSKLKMVLVDPGGRAISTDTINNSIARFEEGNTFQMLELSSAIHGNWNLNVSWEDPPPIAEQVHISIAENSEIYMRLHGLRPQYDIGDPVVLTVDVAEVKNSRKTPLRNANLEIEVQIPEQKMTRLVQARSQNWTMYKDVLRNSIRELKLFDDGLHDDYLAGDGKFGNTFRETAKNGLYLVSATVRGQKQDGNLVEKTVKGSFQVGVVTENPVSTSQTLQYQAQASRKIDSIDNQTPYSDEILQQPILEIEQIQGSNPLDEIESLLQQ